ncbi:MULTISPECIES: hypothetical protein [Paenibacillus]|uniref:Flp pilus assembly protein CpaB n=1 Tax=Paenibacillus aceti TaxID=1820010 RepID=A0ABQ1W5R7_9BACL|nr:hypothetical protein [Paenibacillus aceti]GGG15158.1 hypothetical protein GCM10010913_41310 [Paenibacillus aceti]
MKKLWNKATRRLLIVFVALILAGVAVAIQSSIVNKQVTTELVYVAADNLTPYSLVEGKLVQRKVVKSEVPDDAIRDLKELEGESWVTTEVGILKGIPVSKSMLIPAKESKFGESLELKDGAMFVGVKTDQVKSAGDMIKPGTIVDAYVYIKGQDRQPSELVTPADDPLLKGLLIKDRQNQNGYEPQREGSGNQNPIPAIAVVETTNPDVAAALIKYQQEGEVYFTPTGVNVDVISLEKEVNAAQSPDEVYSSPSGTESPDQ